MHLFTLLKQFETDHEKIVLTLLQGLEIVEFENFKIWTISEFVVFLDRTFAFVLQANWKNHVQNMVYRCELSNVKLSRAKFNREFA